MIHKCPKSAQVTNSAGPLPTATGDLIVLQAEYTSIIINNCDVTGRLVKVICFLSVCVKI